jgi:hypothetical protein
MQLSLLTACDVTISRDMARRVLDVLESLDESEAHAVVSEGQCARSRYWETLIEAEQGAGNPGRTPEPDCDCEMGAVILALSDVLKAPTIRYRHEGKRFGELLEGRAA